MRKEIVCDSSSIIALTESCMIDALYMFSKRLNANFLIPPIVVYETVEHPLSIEVKAYRFSALRIKKAIEDGVLVEVKADTKNRTKELLSIANHIFFARGKPIHLIDLGEAEMIALAEKLEDKILLMDERTTRMLIEAPFRLKEHLEEELNVSVMLNEENYRKFQEISRGMKVIRSVDLIAVAYDVGYFSKYGEDAFNVFSAALYKLKYNGCAVRMDEIEEFLRMKYEARAPS